MEETTYKNCQSCGMPLKNDKGQRDHEYYCSKCYKGNGFTEPNITLEQMQEKVTKEVAAKWKMPTFVIKPYAKKIASLKRWETKKEAK